ncbi:keratin-associated protein 21-1-like isoform X1 [Anas acuta]
MLWHKLRISLNSLAFHLLSCIASSCASVCLSTSTVCMQVGKALCAWGHSREVCLHRRKMTFFQGQCEDDCYSPCGYGGLYGYRGYDCGSPCGYRGYGSLYGYRGLYGFGDRYGFGGLYGSRGFYGYGDGYGYGGLYGGYRGIYGYGDCYGYPGLYSSRYGYPFSSRYGQRYGYGSCYPC